METKLRLINDHGGRRLRLQKRRRQTNESNRAVRELPGLKREGSSFLTPFQSHQLTLTLHLGFKKEIIEERRNQLDRLPNPLVSWSALFPQLQQERSDIPGIRAQLTKISRREVAAHLRRPARIVKVIDHPTR